MKTSHVIVFAAVGLIIAAAVYFSNPKKKKCGCGAHAVDVLTETEEEA